jgi:hypothetical protein
MRTGAATGHVGYFHETAFYGSDDDFLGIVVPFLEGGRDAGEPTIVTLAERNASLVRRAMGDVEGIDFRPGADQYARPAATIRSYRSMFGSLAAGGAAQIRVVGDVPHPGHGFSWDGWARYEAAVNHAYDEFPIWGLCPYDTRTAPTDVLDEVARLHPHVATPDGGHHANDAFTDPAEHLRRRPPAPLDPLEETAPAVVLVDPTPREARAALLGLATPLAPTALEDLLIAVSELVADGRPPVALQIWVGPDRVVVALDDHGPAPTDPFAGLVRPESGGLGLWLAHQLCTEVTLRPTTSGLQVALLAR